MVELFVMLVNLNPEQKYYHPALDPFLSCAEKSSRFQSDAMNKACSAQ